MGVKTNQKKAQQLGMSYGTACNRLRKKILFALIQKVGWDYCFQCGEQITDIDDLSIEHKVPFLDSEDPVKLFFSLDNITFSHLKCNSGAARSFKKKYKDAKERRLAKNKQVRDWRKRMKEKDPEELRRRRREQYRRHGR